MEGTGVVGYVFVNVVVFFDPSIQFTVETESNNQISFLDILIQKTSHGNLATSVYRK